MITLKGNWLGQSRKRIFKRVAKVQQHEVEKVRREINLRLKEKRLDLARVHQLISEGLQG